MTPVGGPLLPPGVFFFVCGDRTERATLLNQGMSLAFPRRRWRRLLRVEGERADPPFLWKHERRGQTRARWQQQQYSINSKRLSSSGGKKCALLLLLRNSTNHYIYTKRLPCRNSSSPFVPVPTAKQPLSYDTNYEYECEK